ncbi:IS5 family transposase ISPst12 [Thauera mechernichensis]
MRSTDHKQSRPLSYVNLEDRIPRDYPLRRVKVLADLVFRSMSTHFDALYAEGERPSIAPERRLRASLLQCLFSIRSERALVEHIDFKMIYRWFLGLTLDEAIWDHSMFSANRDRLHKESMMREFFGGVVAIAEWAELVSDEHFSVVGSLLRAWASRKSMAARDGSDEPPGPDQGRNPEADFRCKKRSNAIHLSRTDPDSRLASKGGGMAFLSYTTHALAENRHGLIVDVHTTAATGTAEREAALVMVKRSVKPASGSRKPIVRQIGVTTLPNSWAP